MEHISKRELLEETGISYGQLYRWKRQKLIPEDWFIKQSSFTGQETFFPREEILGRIQAILEAKDHYSLGELAGLFSPETSPYTCSSEELETFDEIDPELCKTYSSLFPEEEYDFFDLVWLASLTETVKKTKCTLPAPFFQQACTVARQCRDVQRTYLIFETGGTCHIVFTPENANLQFDEGVKMIDECSLRETAEALKLKYKERFCAALH